MDTATAAPPRTGRAKRLRGPVVVAAAAVVALGIVFVVDPNEPGHYPLCPFKALTGWDCPGCGATRGMHALVHGDVAGALDHNVLLAVLVPVALLAWWGWARRAWTGSTVRREIPPALVWVTIGLLLTFWVVRNLPGVPYLGSA